MEKRMNGWIIIGMCIGACALAAGVIYAIGTFF